MGDGFLGIEVAQGPCGPVDHLDVLVPQRPDEAAGDARIPALLEMLEGDRADLRVGLGQYPLDQGRGGLGPADRREDQGQQDPTRGVVLAEDAHQRDDGVRVADRHQLRLGLTPAVVGTVDDRIPQHADPTEPRPLGRG